MKKSLTYILVGILIFFASCNSKTDNNKEQTADTTANASTAMEKQSFGKLPDGAQVYRYTLKNKNGMVVQFINYGGIITSIQVRDKEGKIEDVVLGYDSLQGYLDDSSYFGALIGRYGNRIADGKFTLDGKVYTLAKNNNGQHLHGGNKGFDKVFWEVEQAEVEDGSAYRLTYHSKDMEEGYPGNLKVEVLYILTDNNDLRIEYKATTDKKTIVNLTQHTYFNLSGNAKRNILDHQLMLKSDKFVVVNKSLIPTGLLADVNGSSFDFNEATAVGKRISDTKNEQISFADGYDHTWVLSSKDSLKLAASLYDSISGRLMETYTTEPGIQFYSGNFLDGTKTGKGGVVYEKRHGLCLETQHYPDSPNRPNFPSVVLNPGDVYKTRTIYRFSTM